MIKIGIIKEGKVPPDHRVPFTPEQCKQIMEQFHGTEVFVQSSPIRIIKDEEYKKAGIPVVDDLSLCDIIMGIKEVPLKDLIPNKTYFFFSHTIKKQPHNKLLLKTILQNNITLVDYECLTDEEHNRIIGFGHYAGIVGAYNGIYGYGKKYNLFSLKRACDCHDKKELWEELKKINLPNLKIIVTGNGRVANGAIELLGALHIRRITPYEFTHYTFREPTYTQLHSHNYNEPLDGSQWNTDNFYHHPEKFRSTFMKYTRWCDLLIHCSFWDPRAPKLFTKEEMRSPEFGISVIADVTCDINGSIPSTTKPASIAEPFYGYDVKTEKIIEPFAKDAVTVMAVDNLPCELPRDASESFGKELIEKILPSLLINDEHKFIERGTIAKGGKLMERFDYLSDYASG
ncbi:MAG: alanine dehydrogenase [Bacteroidetes bacterium]|nr:alanine dehydrogenase [Bacteroidota bacterium]